MNRSKPIVIIVVALLLGGCAEGLASLGGSAVSMFGAGVSESIEAKKAAISTWKVERARLNAKVIDRLETQADKLFAANKNKEGLAMLRTIIAEHDKNQPLWLIQKFIRRGDN